MKVRALDLVRAESMDMMGRMRKTVNIMLDSPQCVVLRDASRAFTSHPASPENPDLKTEAKDGKYKRY